MENSSLGGVAGVERLAGAEEDRVLNQCGTHDVHGGGGADASLFIDIMSIAELVFNCIPAQHLSCSLLAAQDRTGTAPTGRHCRLTGEYAFLLVPLACRSLHCG